MSTKCSPKCITPGRLGLQLFGVNTVKEPFFLPIKAIYLNPWKYMLFEKHVWKQMPWMEAGELSRCSDGLWAG
jgi:hypothetical protein